MKNIIKSIVVFLFSISIFSSAYAGSMTVTGNAKATYNITSGYSNLEKGIGVENNLDFTAKGDTPFGTFTYQVQQETGTAGAMSFVDQTLALVTPQGTIAAFISEGGLSLQDAGSRSVYARPTDTGDPSATVDNLNMSAYNSLQYHTPAGLLPFGLQAKIAYAPDSNAVQGADANATGTATTQTALLAGKATAYQITAAPIAGLAIGADYLELGQSGNATLKVHQKAEAGSVYFKYDIGAIGIGASKALYAPQQAAATTVQTLEYYDQLNYSVSFLVNPNLSISYEQEESERIGSSSVNSTAVRTTNADVKNKSNGIQAAYTVGGITLALAHNQHDNVGYAVGKDAENTVFAVTMAF